MPGTWVLNTDGGARGNPGPAGAGIILRDDSGEIVCRAGRYLGETTNNVAEYEGLLLGLEAAAERGARALEVRMDSELIVKQLRREYRVKHPNLKPLYAAAVSAMARFERVDVRHVRRAENAEADALANEAMDARTSVGDRCGSGSWRQDALFGGE